MYVTHIYVNIYIYTDVYIVQCQLQIEGYSPNRYNSVPLGS